MAASLSDSALFMDMELFKEEDDASLTTGAMDFPASSLELVQLLAYDDDFLMDGTAHTADVFAHHDGGYNADDLSDGVTDDASSDMASPPPTFADDDQRAPSSPAVYGFSPACNTASGGGGGAIASAQHPLAVKVKLPAPVSPPAAPVTTLPVPSSTPQSLVPSQATVPAVPSATMLPFAFPVACFPTLNANLKRPLPDVMPNQPASTLDPVELKKSKRAMRQMKNRESANRSRLRRKEQLSDLSVEVEELTKKQHELQNTIAALRAENKSLQDQNSFLRSLVTMYSDPARTSALPPMPALVGAVPSTSTLRPQLAATTRPSAAHHDLESGHKSPTDSLMEESCDEDDDETEDHEVALLPTPKKQRKTLGRSAATVSAASLGLCASVFGLTILTDSDNGAAQSSYIRRPGRVLHSLPSTSADQGCSPSLVASMVERAWELGSSSWAFLTTSELAYGVFLNVLSFVVIMGLYHCFQQYASSKSRSPRRSFRWQNLESSSRRVAASAHAKRRSVSWQDVRVEAQHQHAKARDAVDTADVQVFE